MSRTLRISSGSLVAAALLLLPALAGAQSPTRAPAPAPVKPAALPAFQEATLPNGLRLMLVESRRQPVVSIALMIPAGDSYDPVGKEGLAGMAANVLTKGAGTRTAEQVAATIEGVGGQLFAASGPDFLTVRSSVLATNAPLAFELVGDAVARPTFAAKEVDLSRTQAASALQLEQSNPAALAQRYFAAQLYGQHPYGRRPSATTVRSLTADDLRAFQRTRLVPGGALLVIAGDITMTRARELALRHMGQWSGAAPAGTTRPAPPVRDRTEIVLVHRAGSVQSNIVVGNLTYRPADPRAYALTVANKILGGGTEGRLFATLREKRGWTYGANSSAPRNRDIGALIATAEVRNAVTDSALVELLAIERSLGSTRVPQAELENNRGALVGSLPLQLETAQGIAEQVGRFTMLGLPRDYIRTLRPRLAAVTAADVQSAARDLIRPDRALVVVVGDGSQIYDKLARIAPTRIISTQGDPMQPSDLVQRAAASLPVDATRLVAHSDSFVVLIQGMPQGYQTTSLAKGPAGYSYRTATFLAGGMVQQSGEASFTLELRPTAVKSSGKVQGQPTSTDLAYAGGRVKGSSVSMAAGGSKTTAIDTTVAPTVIDDNMLTALLPGLRWAPNAKFTFDTFDASSGTVRAAQLSVTGTETVTVPAGTFPAYRVEVTGMTQAVTMFVTTAAPHRLVKIAPVGAPVEFVLAK